MIEDVPDRLQKPLNTDRFVILVSRFSAKILGLRVKVVLSPKVLFNDVGGLS